MPKQISPKITALAFGVMVVSFLAVFYVVAWTEPSETPPQGNIATALNTSNVGQSKEGGLVLNIGGLASSNGLIIDKGKLCMGTDCRGSFSEIGLPSGMIAMFNASCPSGWTRFTALDGRFPYGGATYDATPRGSVLHSHSIDAPITAVTPDGPTDYQPDYGNGAYIINMGGNTVDLPPFTGGAGGDLPPYITVVWCQKN